MIDAIANTLARIEHSPTPLSEALAALPGSWEMQLFMGLMLSGTMGMLGHYALKWARDEIKDGVIAYARNNFKSSCLSFFTYTGIAIGAIATGAFTSEYGGFVGWKVVFWVGLTNGFTIDAIVNKTTRARWDMTERIEKTGTP